MNKVTDLRAVSRREAITRVLAQSSFKSRLEADYDSVAALTADFRFFSSIADLFLENVEPPLTDPEQEVFMAVLMSIDQLTNKAAFWPTESSEIIALRDEIASWSETPSWGDS